jgi:hypothetical protein
MTWVLKHKLAVVAAGLIAYFLFRKTATAAGTPPAVVGDVWSGHDMGLFDTNVLSPTFGEPL